MDILINKDNVVVDFSLEKIIENRKGFLANKTLYVEENLRVEVIENTKVLVGKMKFENGSLSKIKLTRITKEDFFKLFTPEQLVAIWKFDDINVQYFKIMLTCYAIIDLQNQETINAITYLKTQNLITQEQFDELL